MNEMPLITSAELVCLQFVPNNIVTEVAARYMSSFNIKQGSDDKSWEGAWRSALVQFPNSLLS